MSPHDLLDVLKAEGVSVELTLKFSADTRPSDATVALVQTYKAALLQHLIRERAVGEVNLPAVLLESLMVWVATYHKLYLIHPSGTQNVTPLEVMDAVALHPWGVVYDAERYRLMSWGMVPPEELKGLHELRGYWGVKYQEEQGKVMS